MKQILKMYLMIPFTLAFFAFSTYKVLTKSGGKEPMEAENLNVKSIRANPTSFRAVFMPRILAGGGK